MSWTFKLPKRKMKNGSPAFEAKQDLAVMKDMILQNLNWYSPAELAACVREGIVTLKEIHERVQVDVHWTEEDDDVELLKIS